MLVNYSWAWGLPWTVVDKPSVTPLIYSLSQQASITNSFLVRGVTLSTSSSQGRDFVCFELMHIQYLTVHLCI